MTQRYGSSSAHVWAGLMMVAGLWVGSGCDSSTSAAKPADAAVDAASSQADAGTRADASSGRDAATSSDDDASAATSYDSAKICEQICVLRVEQGTKAKAPCLSDCLAQWPTLDATCQQVSAELGACVAVANCMPVVQCCYNEAGRYADMCPLSFQK